MIPHMSELRRLAVSLPAAPHSTSYPFDMLEVPSFVAPDDTRSGDEMWEELNPLLHRAFGYGMSVDDAINLLKKAGRNGVERFCQFVEYYVRDRAVSITLFEEKILLVLEAVKSM
jgi:hypothetical protein